MHSTIRLVVGLGNPGNEYAGTRHNAGEEFVKKLAIRLKSDGFKPDLKFFAKTSKLRAHGKELVLMIPTTFMNESGSAVAAYSKFYKINPEEILIAHDDLDISIGEARLKVGGGHGGHNGLRAVISALGNNCHFCRLRIGIGHPGHTSQVTSYVLSKPPKAEKENIECAINNALTLMPLLIEGQLSLAMSKLHGKISPKREK